MPGTVENICRLFGIARVLARHDALFLLERLDIAPLIGMALKAVSKREAPGRPGQRLARALQEAGPSFIKLGQALSTRSDLLGDELAEDLSDLQDRIPPFDGNLAKRTIEAELGAPMDELFSKFDRNPVAAASIAQVHFATTMDGRDVAVKILRPDIESAFNADLDLFFWMAELIERTRPKLRRLKPVESIRALARTVAMEMDLRLEAAAAEELARNFRRGLGFPRSPRRLAIDLATGDDLRTGLRRSLRRPRGRRRPWPRSGRNARQGRPVVLQPSVPGWIFPCGHASGKSFCRRGRRLDRGRFRHHGSNFQGRPQVFGRNAHGISEPGLQAGRGSSLPEAGWVPDSQSVDAFAQAARSIAEPILDRPQNEISIGRLLGQLFQVTETFDMETQPQLLLLQKTMLVCEGTGRKLHPEANMWMLARPLIEDWARRNLGAEAKIRDAIGDAATVIARLPRVLDQIDRGSRMFKNGEIKLHPDTIKAFRNGKGGGRASTFGFWHPGRSLFYGAVIAGLVLTIVADHDSARLATGRPPRRAS